MKYEVTEVCPNCDRENTLTWDTEKDGYKIFCPNCGTRMMLCDACTHADDNPNHRCDWSRKDGCFRAPIKPLHELKFTMKYAGKTLDLSTEHLYQKTYSKYNMADVHASAEFAHNAIAFSENIQDFEQRHLDKAFTKQLDVDPNLTQLFLYMLNAYSEESNLDAYGYDFREWVKESLEEIQDLIDEGEYVICYYCKSIVPKRMTVTVNDGFWKGSVVCPDCLTKILSK